MEREREITDSPWLDVAVMRLLSGWGKLELAVVAEAGACQRHLQT